MKQLIKLFRPILVPGMLAYWWVFRPKTFGAKVVLTHKGEILFVKPTYEFMYSLPGGGIKKGEKPEEAAIREVREEVGIDLDNVKLVGSFVTTAEYKIDTVYVFTAEASNKNVKLDTVEIDTVEWFSLSALPNIRPVTKKMLKIYQNNQTCERK